MTWAVGRDECTTSNRSRRASSDSQRAPNAKSAGERDGTAPGRSSTRTPASESANRAPGEANDTLPPARASARATETAYSVSAVQTSESVTTSALMCPPDGTDERPPGGDHVLHRDALHAGRVAERAPPVTVLAARPAREVRAEHARAVGVGRESHAGDRRPEHGDDGRPDAGGDVRRGRVVRERERGPLHECDPLPQAQAADGIDRPLAHRSGHGARRPERPTAFPPARPPRRDRAPTSRPTRRTSPAATASSATGYPERRERAGARRATPAARRNASTRSRSSPRTRTENGTRPGGTGTPTHAARAATRSISWSRPP